MLSKNFTIISNGTTPVEQVVSFTRINGDYEVTYCPQNVGITVDSTANASVSMLHWKEDVFEPWGDDQTGNGQILIGNTDTYLSDSPIPIEKIILREVAGTCKIIISCSRYIIVYEKLIAKKMSSYGGN